MFCILGAVYKIVRWLQESTFETEAAEYSSLTVHVSSSGTGLMNKYFYRFRNVRILRGRMKFFYDPAGPFVPPTEECVCFRWMDSDNCSISICSLVCLSSYSFIDASTRQIINPTAHSCTCAPARLWVDIISSNATSAQPPTMLVIKVDAPTRWQYLPIDYISVTNGAGACHARATPVVKRPAYLLQVRYSYNIWHTWGEAGLMSLFQTLREMNLLSIATVGPSGTLNELGHGSTASWGDASGLSRVAVDDQETGCPWTYDHVLQRAIRHESCDKVRLPHGATCSPHSQAWCRPGAVVSPLRDSPAAPLIVTYTPQSTKNIWSHLYNTISSNQKTLDDLDGACFEDLIVGKSSTLNFYQALNTTDPAATILEKVPRIDNSKARVESMAIFKAFIISSQREWVERNGLAFEGYDDPGLDLLRQGVVRPDIETLDAINPKECIGNIREEIGELKRNFEAHEALVAPVILDYERKYGPILVPSSLSSQSALKLRDEESEGYFALRDAGRVGAVNTGVQVENSGDGRKTEAPVAAARTADLPIVTYMSRNFFSRGVINEAAILKYLLLNYNVVLKVTTFQEPLGDVMVRRITHPPRRWFPHSRFVARSMGCPCRTYYRRRMLFLACTGPVGPICCSLLLPTLPAAAPAHSIARHISTVS